MNFTAGWRAATASKVGANARLHHMPDTWRRHLAQLALDEAGAFPWPMP
jgi:hypothetical protein